MNLLDLMVKIGVDDQASSKISSIAGGIKSGMGTVAKAGAAAVTATAAVATGATAAMVGAAKDVAGYGDNVDKMSQKMGISAKAYQEWDAVLQHSGSSIDSMSRGMVTLQKKAAGNAEAFQKLGLSQEQVASMSTEELFAATIEGLQGMGEGAERTALASELLGGAAKELGPLLNTSAEDTQAMKDRVNELGGVMSDKSVKAAARFQDSLQDMQTAIGGLKRNMVSEFLPGMATVMDGLGNIFSGDSEGGAAQVSEGVGQIVEKVREAVPKFVEIVSSLAPVLLKALVEVVAAIAKELPSIAVSLVPVIIELAPVMLDAGVQMFMGIVQALADTGPQLIDQLVEMTFSLANTLVDYAPQMLAAALTLFVAIVSALIERAPQIMAKLGELVGNVVKYVIDNAPQMLAAAGQLILQLVQAIANSLTPAMQAMNQVVQGALNEALKFVGSMLSAGGQLVKGVIDGIANGVGGIAKAVSGGVKGAVDTITGFWQSMYDAGSNILGGFIDGIWAGFGNAVDAVAQGLEWVRSYLPFSPAKRGPFSGKGWTLYSGRSLMEAFGEGIEQTAGDAVRSAEAAMVGVSDAMTADFGTPGIGIGGGGTASAAPQIVININDPVIKEEADVDRIFDYVQTRVRRQAGVWSQSYSMA